MTAPDLPLAWNDSLLLGFPAMDEEHRDFVACLLALQSADPGDTAEVAARLDDFAAHARRHFAAEDAWMNETAFPPRQCHIDEHAAVLKSVDEVRALVAQGRTEHVPSLAAALADWFPRHAHHLDSALATWMCKQRFGARPLVLRRGVASAQPSISPPHSHFHDT